MQVKVYQAFCIPVWTIIFSFTLTGCMVEVPDVVGELQPDAAIAIREANLRPILGYQVNGTANSGEVISQQPVAGSELKPGSGVILSISLQDTWAKLIGGAGVYQASSVQQLPDGNFIFGGSTDAIGGEGYDAYLLKTNATGEEIWSNTFGGAGNDFVNAVCMTSDSGYILAGNAVGDAWIIKTDTAGDEDWSYTYGGTELERAFAILEVSSGGYVFAGQTASFGVEGYNMYLVKIDTSGVVQWEKNFGGASWDYAYSLQETSDGGFILAGGSNPFVGANSDLYIVKTNANGIEEWSKTLGTDSHDEAAAVKELEGGGYILAGYTESAGAGGMDMYLVKVNSSGNQLWAKTFGGDGDEYTQPNTLQVTSEGGFIFGGYTTSFGGGGEDCYVVKTDADGIEEWAEAFGGTEDENAYNVCETLDGGFLVVGYTDGSFGAVGRDIYLIKTDALGNAPATP